jgi:hypothetical protein
MSRSNSKVAHLLREADSIKVNKAVLKSDAYSTNNGVFDLLGEANEKYSEKMANLLQFNSKNKKIVKVRTHKGEWIDEQSRLQVLAKGIELSVREVVERTISEAPDDEELHEIIDCMNGYSNARKKNQSELSSQLRNIKDMLQESRKAKPSKKSSVGKQAHQPDSVERTQTPENSAIYSIIAELFMKLRNDHAKVWQYWKKQEVELRVAVHGLQQELTQSMRTDRLLQQDQALRAEFIKILTFSPSYSEATADEELPFRESSASPRSNKASGNGSGGSGGAKSPRLALSPRSSSSKSVHIPIPGGASPMKQCIASEPKDTAVAAAAGCSSDDKISTGTEPGTDADTDTKTDKAKDIGTRGGGGKTKETDEIDRYASVRLDLEMLMDEWLLRIALLDKDRELKILQREAEKATFCSELGLDSSSYTSATTTTKGSNYAGWAENDHDTFVKVYRKAQVTGMQRKTMLDILKAELPEHNLEDILIHEEWYRKMKFFSTQAKEADAAHNTARLALVDQAKEKLQQQKQYKLELLQHELQQEQHEKHRQEIHSKLSQLRAAKAELTDLQVAEQQRLEAERLEAALVQEEAQRVERSEKKAQIEKYRLEREAANRAAQEAMQAQAAEAQAQLKALIEQNKPNVAHRAQLVSEKEAKRRQKEVVLWYLSV